MISGGKQDKESRWGRPMLGVIVLIIYLMFLASAIPSLLTWALDASNVIVAIPRRVQFVSLSILELGLCLIPIKVLWQYICRKHTNRRLLPVAIFVWIILLCALVKNGPFGLGLLLSPGVP